MNASFERSPKGHLRLAGLCYLAIILLGAYGEMVVRAKLFVSGNPTATVQAISGAQGLWRSGIAGDLLMHVLDLPVIVALYFLLKPVNESLSLLAAFINLIQTAVLAANKLTLLVPLYLMEGPRYLTAFSPEQLNTLSYLAIKAHNYGFGVGLIFFGVACVVRGYLMVKSGYVPKVLGVLMGIAGLSYFVNSFAMLAAPRLFAAISPAILLPPLVGELSFALWLIVRGVNVARWHERVATGSSH